MEVKKVEISLSRLLKVVLSVVFRLVVTTVAVVYRLVGPAVAVVLRLVGELVEVETASPPDTGKVTKPS